MQPFISRGSVSVLESDECPDLRIRPYENCAIAVRWKTNINDWALFHAKSCDHLLLLHDYAELLVQTQSQTGIERTTLQPTLFNPVQLRVVEYPVYDCCRHCPCTVFIAVRLAAMNYYTFACARTTVRLCRCERNA